MRAYLLGMRLYTFLKELLPSHPDYHKYEVMVLDQFRMVRHYLQQMAELIDKEEHSRLQKVEEELRQDLERHEVQKKKEKVKRRNSNRLEKIANVVAQVEEQQGKSRPVTPTLNLLDSLNTDSSDMSTSRPRTPIERRRERKDRLVDYLRSEAKSKSPPPRKSAPLRARTASVEREVVRSKPITVVDIFESEATASQANTTKTGIPPRKPPGSSARPSRSLTRSNAVDRAARVATQFHRSASPFVETVPPKVDKKRTPSPTPYSKERRDEIFLRNQQQLNETWSSVSNSLLASTDDDEKAKRRRSRERRRRKVIRSKSRERQGRKSSTNGGQPLLTIVPDTLSTSSPENEHDKGKPELNFSTVQEQVEVIQKANQSQLEIVAVEEFQTQVPFPALVKANECPSRQYDTVSTASMSAFDMEAEKLKHPTISNPFAPPVQLVAIKPKKKKVGNLFRRRDDRPETEENNQQPEHEPAQTSNSIREHNQVFPVEDNSSSDSSPLVLDADLPFTSEECVTVESDVSQSHEALLRPNPRGPRRRPPPTYLNPNRLRYVERGPATSQPVDKHPEHESDLDLTNDTDSSEESSYDLPGKSDIERHSERRKPFRQCVRYLLEN